MEHDLTYPCQGAVLHYLPFRVRKRLFCVCRGVRGNEMSQPYHLRQVSINESKSGLGSCQIKIDGLDVAFFGMKRNGECETRIAFWDWTLLCETSAAAKSTKVLGLTVEEAAGRWVECVFGRSGTTIGTLTLLHSPTSFLNCTDVRVNRLILRTSSTRPNGNSWFSSRHSPHIVEINNLYMLEDEMVKNAGSVHYNSPLYLNDDTLEHILELKCTRLTVRGVVRCLRTFCKTIARRGRPIGFRCSSEYSGTLEWLGDMLKAHRAENDGKPVLTLEMSVGELNLYTDPENAENLVVEVSEKGTAVPMGLTMLRTTEK